MFDSCAKLINNILTEKYEHSTYNPHKLNYNQI